MFLKHECLDEYINEYHLEKEFYFSQCIKSVSITKNNICNISETDYMNYVLVIFQKCTLLVKYIFF